MKKLLVLILTGVMMLSMVSCGERGNEDGGTTSGTEASDTAGASSDTDSVGSDETTSNTGSVDNGPVGDVGGGYNPAKLSTFGLPEPSFPYEYLCYETCMRAGAEHPEFIYVFDSSAEDALEYMKQVSAVWGGWTHEKVPLMQMGDSFWFSTDFENYHIHITWDTEGNHFMFVRDFSKNMYWDKETSRNYIEGLEIGTYGINGTDFTLNGGKKPYYG